MRMQIPNWILEHGRLPHGGEPELLNPIWGFSYGFTPYLPSLVSVALMKLTSLFTTSGEVLFVAMRLEGVLSMGVTWFGCCAIADRILNRYLSRLVFGIFCAGLPQFIFLCSYLNNDAFGVMCMTLIVLCWVKGDQDGWSVKNCVLLALPIAMLALTYYMHYSYILMSIPFFCVSCYHQTKNPKRVLALAMLVLLVALAAAGWYFVRNAVIYHGDFLGINTQRAYGELYAREPYKPSNRVTQHAQRMSFPAAFIGSGYLVGVVKSFIGLFGYMEFSLDSWLYYFEVILIGVLGVLFFVGMFRRKLKNRLLIVCLIVCLLFGIGFAMVYSYYFDFAPQGRYMISALLPINLFAAMGVDALPDETRQKLRNKRIFTAVVIGLQVFFICVALTQYMIPYIQN